MLTVTKVCLICSRELHGRTDKKFCNDYCRNTHHNQLNSYGNNYMRNINHILGKNRRILESILHTRHITKVSLATLHCKGFAFKYVTHSHANKKGKLHYFCYEYGYVKLKNEYVIIMKEKREKEY